MTETKSIADRMAEAAEMDLALPYSLMQDAWKLILQYNLTRLASPERFDEALTKVLDEYDADQNAYWTPERIARARGEN